MQRAFPSAGRFLTMAFMLGHFCAVVLAHSPMLHHWLHGDSDEPGHHCAATALICGQLDHSTIHPVAAVPPAPLPDAPVFLASAPGPLVAFTSTVFGRAPPSA